MAGLCAVMRTCLPSRSEPFRRGGDHSPRRRDLQIQSVTGGRDRPVAQDPRSPPPAPNATQHAPGTAPRDPPHPRNNPNDAPSALTLLPRAPQRHHHTAAPNEQFCAANCGGSLLQSEAHSRQGGRHPAGFRVTVRNKRWSVSARISAVISSPVSGVSAVTAEGVLCAFCGVLDPLSEHCLQIGRAHV